MSSLPEDGVVDRNGKAHEVSNLFVADGSVKLNDDGRRDSDGLTVGQLELVVDRGHGYDGGEAAGDRNRLAVLPDDRTGPGIGHAVAEGLGRRVGGAVLVQRTGDNFAFGVGQGDPLQPAVGHVDPHRRGGCHVFARISRGERQ